MFPDYKDATHRNICHDRNNSILGDGWTPLHLAAMFGRVDVIQILLDAGADPYTRDHNEKDVVDIARQFNHFQIADMLQRYQTVLYKTNFGRTGTE